MPFNGSGVFGPIAAPDYPAVPNTLIRSAQFNNNLTDIFSGLTSCVTRDGQSPAQANLPMAGFRHTGVGLALAGDQYARLDQVTGNSANLITSVGGTTIAYTGTVLGLTAYAAGQTFWFTPNATNTGASTLNLNGLGARNIFRRDGAVVLNQLIGAVPYLLYYDGTQFRIITEGATILAKASSSASAPLNVPHGSAPSAPNNGDVWTTSAGLFTQLSGATRTSAMLEATNIFTTQQTIATTAPLFLWYQNDAPANTGKWRIFAAGEAFRFGTTNDAETSGNDFLRIERTGVTVDGAILTATNISTEGKLTTTASASGAAGFNLPAGTAPSSPVNGDLWTTASGLFARIAGSSFTAAFLEAGNLWTGNQTYSSAQPNLYFVETGAAADAKRWRWVVSGGQLILQTRADNDLSGFTFLTVSRSGVTVTDVALSTKLTTVATSASATGLAVPHGTAPSSPNNGDIWTTTSGLFARINGTTDQFAKLASPTFTGTTTVDTFLATGLVVTAASTSGGAGFRIPHGTAPSGPNNGDIWTTTTGMFARINGVTVPVSTATDAFVSVKKTSSTSRASTAIPAADPDLVLSNALANGSTYVIRVLLAVDSGAGGFRLQLTSTGGNDGPLQCTASTVTGIKLNYGRSAYAGSDIINDAAFGTDVAVLVEFTFAVISPTNSVSVSWSQASPNVANTTVGVRSYMSATLLD